MINVKEFLKDIGRTIPEGAIAVAKGNHIFFLHPTKRYDPITLAIIAVGVGTAVQVAGTIQEGKQAEKIAKQRAAVDAANAEATRKASVEEAKIKGEKGRRTIETQKSLAAVANIRLNVGSPLVIETESRDIIAQDIGFILERGRAESFAFRSRAAIEIAQGKALKRKSKFDALSQGLQGFGSIAFLGADAGLFNTAPTAVPSRGLTPVQRRVFGRK